MLKKLYKSQILKQQQLQIIEIKKVIFENRAPFINCISEINNTQADDAHDIDVVMLIYNLIEYSDTYSKT